MKGSQDDALKLRLKAMIVDECGKDIEPEEIPDGEALFGEESELQLDSLDGLQISMAIQREFGHRITDPKELRRILESVDALADFLQPD